LESNAATQALPDTRPGIQDRLERTSMNTNTKHTNANPSHNAIIGPESSRLATPSIEHVPPLGTHSSTAFLFGRYNAKNFHAKYDPNNAQNAPNGL
jgi:hypothetical protein